MRRVLIPISRAIYDEKSCGAVKQLGIVTSNFSFEDNLQFLHPLSTDGTLNTQYNKILQITTGHNQSQWDKNWKPLLFLIKMNIFRRIRGPTRGRECQKSILGIYQPCLSLYMGPKMGSWIVFKDSKRPKPHENTKKKVWLSDIKSGEHPPDYEAATLHPNTITESHDTQVIIDHDDFVENDWCLVLCCSFRPDTLIQLDLFLLTQYV